MKKNKKLISSIIIIIFFITFSYFNFSEYRNFHKNNYELLSEQKEISNKLSSFKLENIKEIENTEFYNTPNKDLLEIIPSYIENAKNDILLEVYMLSETRTQEALIKAYKKWIKVRIILEKDPYLAYNINNKAYEKLTKAWINVIWSDKSDYSYNHSKVLIIDDLSIVSTWNYSYSTFTKNRDFFIFTKDQNINKKLRENFENDFKKIKINIFDNNLVFSPNSSRIIFEKMFLWAKQEIKMYFQYFDDDLLVEKLINLKNEKNIDIQAIIPSTAKNDENVLKMEKAWIKIYSMSKYTMHAKAILIDQKYLYIWSTNFSNNSLDNNREVWILLINKLVIDNFLWIYKWDL